MRYGSICSGIEAATVAWHPLGWSPVFFSEIEPFPRAVLAHHYPVVPLHGDFTTIGEDDYGAIDLLAGGTPCQDFSVAGLRAGITGERGSLTFEFIRLAARKKPRWVVWENVPGVLSSDNGRAFAAFLGRLGECGYGFAYRILDAQYFGVPQRRRRVFVIGYLGDWRPPAAVLFERESLRGDITPIRETRQGTAEKVTAGTARHRGAGQQPETLTAHTLTGEGFDASSDGSGRGIPLVTGTLNARKQGGGGLGTDFECMGGLIPDIAWALQERDYKGADSNTKEGHLIPVASFKPGQSATSRTIGYDMECVPSLEGGGGGNNQPALLAGMAMRRLTPRECERLQGFPDDYTLVPYRGKPAMDGPRYRAIGNSMHTGTMRWLGERIQQIEAML